MAETNVSERAQIVAWLRGRRDRARDMWRWGIDNRHDHRTIMAFGREAQLFGRLAREIEEGSFVPTPPEQSPTSCGRPAISEPDDQPQGSMTKEESPNV